MKLPAVLAVTVRFTVLVCVIPAPLAVMVMADVPVAAVAATTSVSVDEPDPGAAIEAGLKVAVTPLGRPDADKATAELKPPETDVLMEEVPLLPCTTETDVGEAASVKAGAPAAVTVSETVAECVIPPPVPVIVIVEVPVAAVEPTVIVTVDVPDPGVAIEAGEKLTVTPDGCPLADKAIAESKPPEIAVVMVDVPAPPCTTEADEGEAPIVNAGVWLVGANALIRPTPLGLPQPVTRS